MVEKFSPISVAIAWCIAWGEGKEPQHNLGLLNQMRQALNGEGVVPKDLNYVIDAVKEFEKLENLNDNDYPNSLEKLKQLVSSHSKLWNSQIGLVYGGATKIKQYVFEESKLPDIRGASARLDQINLVDLPAFFSAKLEDNLYNVYAQDVREWLDDNYPELNTALIPELIIYSSGGNILAFCPIAFIDDLANAIEKRYTERTITANSCAVGDKFRILELVLGLLRDNIEDTFWLEHYRQNYKDAIVEACFGKIKDISALEQNFKNRKSFNELTTKLAISFNQRRSGNKTHNRPSRCYPPMLETHPYIKRDETEKRSAITKATNLIGEPYLSEVSAIKRQYGDRAKNGRAKEIYGYVGDDVIYQSWINRFEKFLDEHPEKKQQYFGKHVSTDVKICESLTQLSQVSKGYVAYIYADGNNMGGAIQKIRTPQEYQDFSADVDNATKYSVYQALATHLHPRKLDSIAEDKSELHEGDLIHPFEIITIGGDDIILIVPADKAIEIARTIGEQFEEILLGQVEIKDVTIKGDYKLNQAPTDISKWHRYNWQNAKPSSCTLSISSGVLITAYNTPIYYAQELTQQLMKSAKDYAKTLKLDGYYGGTVDFLVMKSVTMISSNIKEFRANALIVKPGPTLKLYAAPYTLYELDGLLKAIIALKQAKFPKSQLYQVRSFLEKGKRTAILNYHYFRSRLQQGQAALKQDFEIAWCQAKTNEGNIAPWMYETRNKVFETIWRDLVDLYAFIEEPEYPSLQVGRGENTNSYIK